MTVISSSTRRDALIVTSAELGPHSQHLRKTVFSHSRAEIS